MIAAIADILKDKLTNLPWLERFGGLVTLAQRPRLAVVEGGAQVVTGYDIYPVACDVNAANCWENGVYKHFEPDSSKAGIAFFVDNGGSVLREYHGPKNANLVFTFDLKFLCWLNLTRLGTGLTLGHCNVSGRLTPLVMAQFWGKHDAFGKFDGGQEEHALQDIEVTSISQPIKNPSVFAPFTFATDQTKAALFMYPYDYFALRVQGTFRVNVKCLEDVFFAPAADCIDGAGIIPDATPANARLTEGGDFLTNQSGAYRVQE